MMDRRQQKVRVTMKESVGETRARLHRLVYVAGSAHNTHRQRRLAMGTRHPVLKWGSASFPVYLGLCIRERDRRSLDRN